MQVVVSLGKPRLMRRKPSKLFVALQAGVFDCVEEVTDDLRRATLLWTYVGNKVKQLMVTSSFQVVTICSQFGKYVKLLVEMNDQNQELESAQALTRPNAVDILMNSQRRMLRNECEVE